MRRISIVLCLVLMVGAFVSSAPVARANHTYNPGQDVRIPYFAFVNGKWIGKAESERRLCLNGRSIGIYKQGLARAIATVPLDFSKWSTTTQAKFSSTKVKGAGDYYAKLEETAVGVYGRSWKCQGASSKVIRLRRR